MLQRILGHVERYSPFKQAVGRDLLDVFIAVYKPHLQQSTAAIHFRGKLVGAGQLVHHYSFAL